jgi:hypothetical protein
MYLSINLASDVSLYQSLYQCKTAQHHTHHAHPEIYEPTCVFPGVFEVKAIFLRLQIMLTSEDLPTFDRPYKSIGHVIHPNTAHIHDEISSF